MVQPRNYLLLACHASNESVQLYQLSRWLEHRGKAYRINEFFFFSLQASALHGIMFTEYAYIIMDLMFLGRTG